VKFESVDEILDFAIQREQDAADFYNDLAKKMDRRSMKDIFLSFAGEEKGHKAKLLAVKKGQKLDLPREKILDLKIGDYLAEVRGDAELDYQQALILAMKSEKISYRLYNDLAEATKSSEMKTFFLALAQEEAKHKLRFELEYDDQILRDN
jgi:rubrerythrin